MYINITCIYVNKRHNKCAELCWYKYLYINKNHIWKCQQLCLQIWDVIDFILHTSIYYLDSNDDKNYSSKHLQRYS